MNIKELIKELSDYPQDTRIDFILLDKDWEDSTKDTYLNVKGIVGSGADDVNEYIEFGLEYEKWVDIVIQHHALIVRATW